MVGVELPDRSGHSRTAPDEGEHAGDRQRQGPSGARAAVRHLFWNEGNGGARERRSGRDFLSRVDASQPDPADGLDHVLGDSCATTRSGTPLRDPFRA